MIVFRRLEPRAKLVRFWQTPAKLARLDATGLTGTVVGTTLPFTPEIIAINAAQGEFQIEAPSVAELEQCEIDRAYSLDICLISGAGARIVGFRVSVAVQ